MHNGRSHNQTISGNAQVGFAVNGDSFNNTFNQHNTFNQTDEPFTQIDVESMAFFHYDKSLLKRLTNNLKVKRSIIIHGDFDTLTFARHIAAHFNDRSSRSNINFKIFEVDKKSLDMLREIERIQEPRIYIIPNLAPSQINYELEDLIKPRKNTYIITTSKDPINKWRYSKHEEDNFSKIATEEIYTKEFLKSYLNYELSILHNDNLRVGHLLTDTIKDKIIESSESDRHISIIVKRISTLNKNEINLEIISTIIEDVTKNNQEDIIYRLLRSYQERDQILILALTLFDDLAEEQFFDVLEILFEKSWSKYFTLYRYDAKDLDTVRGFINIVTIRGYERKLQCKFSKRAVLKAFYSLYPGHIRKAIPALRDFLLRDIPREYASIYNIPYRKDKLDQTIVSTLSTVGLISPKNIIYSISLLLLNDRTLNYASEAISLWYIDDGNRTILFRYLESLLNEKSSNYSAILLNIEETDKPKIHKNIKSHFLKIITLLSAYYNPNHLEQSIIYLFNRFIEKNGEEIDDTVFEDCISELFDRHPDQIYQYFIDDKLTKKNINFIGSLLQIKYDSDTEAVWKILRKIYADIKNSLFIDNLELLVLFNVYSGIVQKEHIYSNRVNLIKERSLYFLDNCSNREIRKQIINTCQSIVARDPRFIPEILPKIGSGEGFDEKEEIISLLLNIAKDQRSTLYQGGETNSEQFVTLEGRQYPYLEGERYSLPIEDVFHSFILEEEDIDALSKQFSLEFLIRANLMLIELEERIERIFFMRYRTFNRHRNENLSKDKFELAANDDISTLQAESLGWFDREIICRFITYQHPEYRKIVVYLAPKALSIHREDPGSLNKLLLRWKNYNPGYDLATISRLLRRAVDYLLYSKYIFFAFIGVLALLVCIAFYILASLF